MNDYKLNHTVQIPFLGMVACSASRQCHDPFHNNFPSFLNSFTTEENDGLEALSLSNRIFFLLVTSTNNHILILTSLYHNTKVIKIP